MNREVHVRFWEGLGGKFPRATRLCALVPPPGFHMVRYFGVFASHHHLRARIVPPAAVPAPVLQLALGLTNAANDTSSSQPAVW